jgi:hypothetical protein
MIVAPDGGLKNSESIAMQFQHKSDHLAGAMLMERDGALTCLDMANSLILVAVSELGPQRENQSRSNRKDSRYA